jgi:hypothetical protein
MGSASGGSTAASKRVCRRIAADHDLTTPMVR